MVMCSKDIFKDYTYNVTEGDDFYYLVLASRDSKMHKSTAASLIHSLRKTQLSTSPNDLVCGRGAHVYETVDAKNNDNSYYRDPCFFDVDIRGYSDSIIIETPSKVKIHNQDPSHSSHSHTRTKLSERTYTANEDDNYTITIRLYPRIYIYILIVVILAVLFFLLLQKNTDLGNAN
jgi:hypothetical protein